MKQKMLKKTALLFALVIAISSALTGCGQSGGDGNTPPPESSSMASETPSGGQETHDSSENAESTIPPSESAAPSEEGDGAAVPTPSITEPSDDASTSNTPPVTPVPTPAPKPAPEPDDASSSTTLSDTTLEVRFGDDGAPFTLYLYDNDTAAAIAGHVGTADWRLPIYHYDDYTNWEIMQYYDIPSRYDIPSNPESVTTVKAGAVYYSEPNRIILFYGDGEVSSEYTPVGYIDYSQELVDAVENNPVVPGWSNKLIHISTAD